MDLPLMRSHLTSIITLFNKVSPALVFNGGQGEYGNGPISVKVYQDRGNGQGFIPETFNNESLAGRPTGIYLKHSTLLLLLLLM